MPDHRHLRRLSEVWQKQPFFFITTCVAGRRRLLAEPAVCSVLKEEWSGLRRRYGWWIGKYVIVPDHVHFFTTQEPGTDTPMHQAIGKWKEWTAKRVLGLKGEDPPLWQPEFFDHLLRNKESLVEKWGYVRDNPVRAGLVGRSEDWPYTGSVDFS